MVAVQVFQLSIWLFGGISLAFEKNQEKKKRKKEKTKTTHNGSRADEQRKLANLFVVRILFLLLPAFILSAFIFIGFVTHLLLSGFFVSFLRTIKKEEEKGQKANK